MGEQPTGATDEKSTARGPSCHVRATIAAVAYGRTIRPESCATGQAVNA